MQGIESRNAKWKESGVIDVLFTMGPPKGCQELTLAQLLFKRTQCACDLESTTVLVRKQFHIIRTMERFINCATSLE